MDRGPHAGIGGTVTRLTEWSIAASIGALVGAACGFVAGLVLVPRGRW